MISAMAERTANIKRLAKEFGLTSRQLLDRCRAEGLPVQNSITKLRDAQARRVRSWFEQGGPENPREKVNCSN